MVQVGHSSLASSARLRRSAFIPKHQVLAAGVAGSFPSTISNLLSSGRRLWSTYVKSVPGSDMSGTSSMFTCAFSIMVGIIKLQFT